MKMTAALVDEIPRVIPLELQPVDDPRFGLVGVLFICRLGILQRQQEPAAIGRPVVALHPLRNFGELLGFAAQPTQRPHLGFSAVAGSEKGEVFAVGAPAGPTGRATLGGHRQGIAAFRRDHPNPRLRLFLLERCGAHGVGDPSTIGTDLRVANPLDRE